jgi:hypothetical protein
MQNHTEYFLAEMADEKIADARRAAGRERLSLTELNMRRERRQVTGSRLSALLRMLAGVFRLVRPVTETRR